MVESRKMVRHRPLWPIDFDNRFAGIWSNLLAGIHHPVRRANEGFGQVSRIGDDADEGQVISVTNPVFRQCRAIAPWNRKLQPPAVEPPPPVLHAPEDVVQPTKPARRRRTTKTAVAALPAAPADEKPKRTRTRKTPAVKSTARKKKSP